MRCTARRLLFSLVVFNVFGLLLLAESGLLAAPRRQLSFDPVPGGKYVTVTGETEDVVAFVTAYLDETWPGWQKDPAGVALHKPLLMQLLNGPGRASIYTGDNKAKKAFNTAIRKKLG